MISVVIPTHNQADVLSQTINSLLQQDLDDLEIIISDTAPTEASQEVMKNYKAQAIVNYYANETHRGSAANFNQAIAKARGEFILFQRPGDTLEPGALARLYRTLVAQPECGYVFGRYRILLPDATCIPGIQPDWLRQTEAGVSNEFANLLASDQYVNLSAMLIRRNALPTGVLFDEALTALSGEEEFCAFDWDWLIRLSLSGIKSAHLDDWIATVRQQSAAAQASYVNQYIVSGQAVTEYMTLLDRYFVEENFGRLAGYVPRIRDLLHSKYQLYCQHGEPASPALDEAIKQRYAALDRRFISQADPYFSVIVTTYHRPRLIGDALSSILKQTLADFEVIVVNDGGVGQEVILDWFANDPRITYVRQPNRGRSAARNTALKLARGQYIVYLDDDNIMLPHHLDTLKKAHTTYPEHFLYTDAELVSEALEAGVRKEVSRAKAYPHEAFDFTRLQTMNYIPVNTWCHPRSLLDKAGYFDESIPFLESWELLIRFSRVTSFHHVRNVTVEVRQRQSVGDNGPKAEHNDLHAMYQRIYNMHDDLGDRAIQTGRAAVLASNLLATASLFGMDYQAWFDAHAIREVDAEILAERMMKARPANPKMTLLMKITREKINCAFLTLESLQKQLYPHWRLILIADYPAPDPIFQSTETLGWLHIESVDDPQLFTEACNLVAQEIAGDWVGLFPAGVEFSPDWLLRCADYTHGKADLQAFYCDHDVQLAPGLYTDPYLKPEFSLAYLLNYDYIKETVWFRQASLASVGGVHAYPEGEVYDLLLRFVDQYGVSAIGHMSDPLLHLPKGTATQLALASRQVAIENHLSRVGLDWHVGAGLVPETFRLFGQVRGAPIVSIVIPNRDKLDYLQPCIESIFNKTDYPAWEILLIDNGSTDPDTLAYYKEITVAHPDRIRVLEYTAPFNFSAQCNLGVAEARGEFILLLNNDTQMLHPEWLSCLVMHGQRPDIGVVGARLIYPETSLIQHAGILLGSGRLAQSVASHYGLDEKIDAPGYMNRLQCDGEVSAVTAACMLVRRSTYQAVGGFNEALSMLYNDVDFCLRVQASGKSVLWTPYSTVVHHHGKSIQPLLKDARRLAEVTEQNQAEARYMFDTWLERLARDPYYNRHLSLCGKPFELDKQAPAILGTEFTERPRVVAVATLSGGSGEYRITQPLTQLGVVGQIQPCIYHESRMLTLAEVARLRPDILVFQNAITDPHLEALPLYRRYFPSCLIVMGLDDLIIAMPEESSLYRDFMRQFRDGKRRVRQALAHVDRVIVSTEPLAEFARQYVDDVMVIPNRLRKDLWYGLTSQRGAGKKPRVGWVGARQHKGDLALLRDVIVETANEVEWVFMGMVPEGVEHLIHEIVDPVPYHLYPSKMASLNLDLAVAPLELHPFNQSKSNLRLLEYGVLGWAVICTNIEPYRENNAPVERVENTKEAWVRAIREHIHDLTSTYRKGDALKSWVEQHYFLEDHLADWSSAYSR